MDCFLLSCWGERLELIAVWTRYVRWSTVEVIARLGRELDAGENVTELELLFFLFRVRQLRPDGQARDFSN